MLRALHVRFRGPLYGYARRALGDDGAADEVVQDVLLRAWQQGHTLERLDELGPRVFTVARNLIIDRHRRTRVRPVADGSVTASDGIGRDISDGHASSRATSDHNDEWADVTDVLARWELVEAIRRLTPTHRGVLVEVFYRDATIATAAQTLGIAEGTVKSRLHYGLRALRDILDEMGTPT